MDYLSLGLCLCSGSFETWDSSGPLGAPVELYPLPFGTLPGRDVPAATAATALST